MIGLFFARFREVMGGLLRTLRLVWDANRLWTIASALVVLLQSITPALNLYLIGALLDGVTHAVSAGGDFGAVVPLVVLTGLVTLFGGVLSSISSFVNDGLSMALSDHVLNTIHAKSVEVDLEYYENPQFYNRLHRAQQEAPWRPAQVLNSFLQTARDTLTLISLIGLLFWVNKWTPLLLFISGMPVVFIRLRFSRLLFEWRQRSVLAERRAVYASMLLTYEDSAKELRLFDLGRMFMERFNTLRAQLRHERIGLMGRQTLLELGTQTITITVLFFALLLVVGDALQGVITLGGLVVAFQAFQRGQGTFQSLLAGIVNLYENNLFLKDFYEFSALSSHVISPDKPQPFPLPMREGICFEHVAFRYQQGTSNVLNDINLTIKPGEVIALVGENGAGKTTLIKLLCRLYDPSAGRITIDGIDLRDLTLTDLRRSITALFQDYNQYQMMAWENIWLGNVEEAYQRDKIVEAAQASGADEVIAELSEGYETQLGNWFGGQELSVGQWQKVALARAFLRHAQLVVLDEPTSSLDVVAEHEVFERFREIIAGRSAVLISHRLSTVRRADRIYVLDGGIIAESGTHDELIAHDGIYARLFRMQSQYYC